MQLKVQPTAIVILVAVVSVLLSSIAINFPKRKGESASHSEAVSEGSMVKEIYGVKIERNPPQSRLDELKVSSWPTYTSGPTKIPWTFKSTETMYLLEGKVRVHVVERPEDDGEGEGFEIGGGDLVVFPKGMNIMWDVVESVKKHYHLDKDDPSSAQAS